MKQGVKAVVTVGMLAASMCAGIVTAGSSSATTVTTAAMVAMPVAKVLPAASASAPTRAVVLTDGETINVPARDLNLIQAESQREISAAHPDNIVPGNCGYSYIYVNHKSNGQPVHMDTGFEVIHDAISYEWHAQIDGFSGSGYAYTYSASGDLAFDPGWHGQHSSAKNYPHGDYHDYVLSPSYALLDTGSICVAASGRSAAYDLEYL